MSDQVGKSSSSSSSSSVVGDSSDSRSDVACAIRRKTASRVHDALCDLEAVRDDRMSPMRLALERVVALMHEFGGVGVGVGVGSGSGTWETR
jgi:hypothetical protein